MKKYIEVSIRGKVKTASTVRTRVNVLSKVRSKCQIATSVPPGDAVNSIVAPLYQPTNLRFANGLGSTVDVAYDAALDNPTGYLVVYVPNFGVLTQEPSDNIAYTSGQVLGNGIVRYRGNNINPTVTFDIDGQYYVYSYNQFGLEIVYKKEVPLVGRYPFPIYEGNEATAAYPNYLNNQFNIHEMNDAVRDFIDLKELLYIHEMNDAN